MVFLGFKIDDEVSMYELWQKMNAATEISYLEFQKRKTLLINSGNLLIVKPDKEKKEDLPKYKIIK